MHVLARLWQALVRLSRTMTVGRFATAYVVAGVLVFVGLFIAGMAAVSTGSGITFGARIVYSISAVLLWAAVLTFVVFTGAAIVKLARVVTGR